MAIFNPPFNSAPDSIVHRDPVVQGIEKHIQLHPDDTTAYDDMLTVLQDIMRTHRDLTDIPDVDRYVKRRLAEGHLIENEALSHVIDRMRYPGHVYNRWFRNNVVVPMAGAMMRAGKYSDVDALNAVYKKSLWMDAKVDFDAYLLFVEQNRDVEKRFYQPRRYRLKAAVDLMQELDDNKIDLLAISLPPGTGKTTLAIFYLTWLAGKYPTEQILTGSHNHDFIRGVYDECLRIFDPRGEYLWCEVFRDLDVVGTNAKDCRIDIGKRKRFETLEFTSLGSGNAGLYRATRLLYADDLVSGLEVALSRDRLDKLWAVYTTDLRQRKQGDHCKELHIATRWSVSDVIGRLEQQYEGSDRAKFITIPALNENDESNFDYTGGVGFSTAFYHEQREVMDDASWRALYMNQPIEREGLLYSHDELRRYFDLPEGEPDAIISVCDTKDRGSDYCVMPIAYQYGSDYYIEDVVCDNSNPEVVEPRLVQKCLHHKVQLSRFESNSAGGRVAQGVQEAIKKAGGRTRITTKFTTANKETKIIMASPFVKEHFLFKDDSVVKGDQEYRRFMNMVCGYTMAGRNKHDDCVDALAMLADLTEKKDSGSVEVFQRPW